MMDVPSYAAGIRHKKRAYEANRIPAVFIYPQDLTGPKWPEKTVRRVYRAVASRYSDGRRAYSGPHKKTGAIWRNYF